MIITLATSTLQDPTETTLIFSSKNEIKFPRIFGIVVIIINILKVSVFATYLEVISTKYQLYEYVLQNSYRL